MEYLSPIINILLVIAFIADRAFRLRSIKEYREAKEAQIENFKQQLEIERKNNDIEITEMHKKRYESLKIILDERNTENENYKNQVLELKTSLEDAKKDVDVREQISQQLQKNLTYLEHRGDILELEKRELQLQIDNVSKLPASPLSGNADEVITKLTIHIVSCIQKRGSHYDPHERISSIGGINSDGTRWKLPENDAIKAIEGNRYRFQIKINNKNTLIVIATHNGRKYLKAETDGYSPDNLLSFPECP